MYWKFGIIADVGTFTARMRAWRGNKLDIMYTHVVCIAHISYGACVVCVKRNKMH
jgi:hypothetical protein